MHASDADIEGKITATSGSIAGKLVTSGINASNITSGRLNISDGSGHYLRMGFGEGDNPFVSGLNVGDYGINMHGNGISKFGGASSTGSYTMSSNKNITITASNNLYLGGAAGTSHILLHSSSG